MAQVMSALGRIKGLKVSTTSNGKDKVTFRLAVRKSFVKEADKQQNKTHVFLPMIAMGPTATFIKNYFNEGDMIYVTNMEYQTYRTQNADSNTNYDDGHLFFVNSVAFAGGGSSGNAQGNKTNQTQQTSSQPDKKEVKESRPLNLDEDDLPF